MIYYKLCFSKAGFALYVCQNVSASKHFLVIFKFVTLKIFKATVYIPVNVINSLTCYFFNLEKWRWKDWK